MDRPRIIGTLAVLVAVSGLPASGEESRAIDFDREVRPLLSDRCYSCHGPDEEERQAELRLDIRDAIFRPGDSGRPAVVPGKPAESELIRRIRSSRKGLLMPPPESGKRLTDAEKALLERWIAGGAEWATHWSLVPPSRRDVPDVVDRSWSRNPIDRFILARLEAEGLRPSPEADRATLIRRLSFDLTGLPPTPAEVDAFLGDRSPGAYEAVVDRLLASPRHGERMALDWLDVSRFADTHGYHLDSGRDMTRWRTWVIDAFNRDLPFDRFTVEQLAGDLIPGASLSQKIASGFHRNHMINYEGGAIPEEYHNAYVVDRVNTTGTVWLGLTVGCAQCHDHKFDPIAQKEYYQLYAFFHNVAESGLDGKKGNALPLLKLPSAEQEASLGRMTADIAAIGRRLAGPWPELDVAQAAWEEAVRRQARAEWTALDPSALESENGATLRERDDRSIVAEGENPDRDVYRVLAPAGLDAIRALRVEALPDEAPRGKGPGRSANGNVVLSEVRVALTDALTPGRREPLKFKAATADHSQDGFPVADAIDGKPETGWAIGPKWGEAHAAVFAFERPPSIGCCDLLEVTLVFASAHPRHTLGRFRLSVSADVDPVSTPMPPARVVKLLEQAPERRGDAGLEEIRAYFRTRVAPEGRRLGEDLARLKAAREELEARIPTTMVMDELPRPRETFLLERGQYDKHGARVEPGVPASLPPLPDGVPRDRLALARWLVDPGHPLVGRVIVNRYWQMIFGTGIVKTVEDFGSQGDLPSHPELLDWLALDFVSPGDPGAVRWSVKGLIRRIVTSSTYRQASTVTPVLLARDPENRLLARGPRFRLQAEFLRDQALAVGGLLDGRIGGASVSPYQPGGLWEELTSRLDGAKFSAQVYVQGHGPDLYRRTMYTFWKRTSPPPSLATFDAPDRETCTVRRARTNTPLQALVLLNDPTYVESARKLAERLMTEGGADPDARIALAFRLVTARPPRETERAVLRALFEEQRTAFRVDEGAALKLLRVGESGRDGSLEAGELAAWTVVASTILNLDEALSKN